MKEKIGNLTKIKTGKLDANASSADGIYPFFTCSRETLKISTYSYDCECVLIAGNGDLNVKYYNGKFDAYQRTYIIEANGDGRLYIPYLYYFMNSYVEELRKQSIGGVIKYIKLGNLTNAIMNLPSFELQKVLVSIFNKVTALIASQEKTLLKLEELVKSRFVEMFGEPETNPYGWRKTTVGDVCSSVVRGPFGSALKKEFFVEPNGSTYKVYEQKHAIQKSATIGTYYISAEKFGELRRFECLPGDILMSCSGTMGELFQLPSGCERGVINQALCKFTLSDCILPIVFLTYMRQTIGNLETKGSGIQNIAAVSYVKAMPINLPPMEVQRRFAAFVAEVDKSKLAVKQSLEKLETLKKSLMQQYFG